MPELIEWNYGNYEGITTAEIRQTVLEWTIWDRGCPGIENATAMQDRCEQIIEHALDISNKGDIFLFAHGHILHALTGTWLGLGATAGRLFKLDTGQPLHPCFRKRAASDHMLQSALHWQVLNQTTKDSCAKIDH